MSIKNKLDPEIKLELLIKLSFGIPMDTLINEYDLTKAKIINLRKNNYILYNEFFEHWKILKEVAVLGLAPKHERALSVVKKFYRKKIEINEQGTVFYNGEQIGLDTVVDLADYILEKDNILNFKNMPMIIKNHY